MNISLLKPKKFKKSQNLLYPYLENSDVNSIKHRIF